MAAFPRAAARHLCISILLALSGAASGLKELVAHKDFQAVMAEAGGRPVIIKYYSMSCGPCRMIAPHFKQLSKKYAGRAYFRKVDTRRNGETASHQQIRSLPTFQFWLGGKKKHEIHGGDLPGLQEWTRKLVEEADRNDVEVTREALEVFYQKHDPAKATPESIDKILAKNSKDFGTMVRLLQKKYGEAPKTQPRRTKADAGGSSKAKADESANSKSRGPNLQAATTEELREELEQREEDAAVEQLEEEEMRYANNPCSLYRNRTVGAIEKVVIIGGGPSGMTAAIYAARANLCPLIIAPSMGGQLMTKGVDVENYPGMPREHGGKMIDVMRRQARSFFAEVRDDAIVGLNASVRPFEITTNTSGTVRAHTIIVATGADSRWLHAEGEWEYRGNGVSSCAACDGHHFMGKSCAVVGGGDSAMEDALMLARLCSDVELIHRRDEFRASSVLQQRVLSSRNINVRWNTAVKSYKGKTIEEDGLQRNMLTHLELQDTQDQHAEPSIVPVDGVFVAIGHDPNTGLLQGQVDMDESNYLVTSSGSTMTSQPGIFAAGDVADHIYRQAITAAGTGAMAALDTERYLSVNPVDEEQCVQQEDFSTWSIKDLRAQIRLLGLKCVACTEKSNFIQALKASY